MLKFSRRCSRCGAVEVAEKCYERHFISSFNEVLCDPCVENLLEKGQISAVTDADGNIAYKQNLEDIYKKIIEIEEENQTLEKQMYQNKRMLQRLERIKDFVEMNTLDRE
ncbi:MAG: hypothetical protein ACOX2F_12870 [bacterium]